MRRLPALLLATALALVPTGARIVSADDWGAQRDPFNLNDIARYKANLRANPHDGGSFAKLLEMYGRYRTVDLLKSEYQKVLDKTPDDWASLVVLGRLFRSTNDNPRALDLYTLAVAKKDADPQTWLYIGEIQKAANKIKEARGAYYKALAHASAKDMQKKALRSLADLALATGDNDGANAYFKQFLALDPNNAQLWIERGDAMLAAGKRDVALESYAAAEKLLGTDPARRMEVIARRGQALEGMGKDDEAVVEYRRAIKSAPKGYYLEVELTGRIVDIYRRKGALPALLAQYEKEWPEGARGHFEWSVLGKLYEETGAQDKAIVALRKAVQKSPWELETQRRLIALLENSGRDDEALAQYEAVVRAAPGEARFQLELAERYWRRGQEKKALDALVRLEGRFPTDPGVISAIADIYTRWGKEDLAIAEFEKLAKIEPEEPSHLVTLGEQYWQKGDKAKAFATWKRLTLTGKPAGLAKYGEVLGEHGNPGEALANLDKAIEKEPKNIEFYKMRAAVYESRRDPASLAKAVEDYDKILALIDNKPQNRLARIDARRRYIQLITKSTNGAKEKEKADEWSRKFKAGDVEAGYFLVEYYKKKNQYALLLDALKLQRARVPDDQELIMTLVAEYRRVRKFDEAVALLLELTKLAPSREREAYTMISAIKTEARKDDEAIEWAQKALQKNPTNPQAHEELAERYVEMQRFPEAIAAYEQTVKLDAHNSKAHFALAQLYVQTGTPQKAVELLRAVLRNETNEDILGRAGNAAIDLEEMTDTLGELEKVISPLSFMMAHKPVYRRQLVLLYLRYVPRLVERVRHGNAEVRKAATTELERIGGLGLQPLLEALRDQKDVNQQRVAVAVLGHLGNKGAAPPLVRIARQEPVRDPIGGPRHVGTLPEPVTDLGLRIDALVAAGRLGDPNVLVDVLPLADHQELGLRESATFTIGRTGDKRAVAPLVSALGDKVSSVQMLACLGLGNIDDVRVVPALTAALAETRRADSTRAACAYALGMRKATAGIPALLAALVDNRNDTQRLAAWALGQIGDPRTLGPLVRAYFARAGRPADEIVWAIGRTSNLGMPPAQPAYAGDYPMRGANAQAHYAPDIAIGALPGTLPVNQGNAKLVIEHADDIAKGLVDALAEHRDVIVSVLADLDTAPNQISLGVLVPVGARDGKLVAALDTIGVAIAPAITANLAGDDPKVRALAISVLAKLDGKVAGVDAAIATALADPTEQVREAAMYAIATVGARRAIGGAMPTQLVAALAKVLHTGPWADRRVAALAMGRLGASADLTALAKAVVDPSNFVREAVAMALGQIGSPAVVDALLTLSRDAVAPVRAAAATSLGKLADDRARKRRIELVTDPDPAVRAAASSTN
ncbi:MAG: HEAT repeat domain-containing protein [Proteobacteria bacterium]|nr:HEAT repeat domain-containing protein [Pseudomonadota bacterium]